MGLIKFLKLFQSVCFFYCQGNSFPHDRSRVLKSKLAYVSSNLWSVKIELSGISGVIGVGVKKLWKIAGIVDGLLYNLNASEQILNLTIFSNFKISRI